MGTRFDAMLTTAMLLDTGSEGAAAAAWRQMIDLVAQSGDGLDSGLRRTAFERLEFLRKDVPVSERRAAAAALVGRVTDAGIVALFAGDMPSVAAPVLMTATLPAGDWQVLIGKLSGASRNVLRNRRDLGPIVEAALARFTPGDLALPPVADGAGEARTTPITTLLERIEAFQARAPLADRAIPAVGPVLERFAFETRSDGVIDWIEGNAREALIGIELAQAAPARGYGVDGGTAGAWRRRAPFHETRLSVAGNGPASGNWLISGAPIFHPDDGRFAGYRGAARRPWPGEQAGGADADGPETAIDSMRQLVHELRTPLNAILGFAEMIDRQLLGPAAIAYRERAHAIIAEASRLVTVLEDLDTAARLESGQSPGMTAIAFDLSALVDRLVLQHRLSLETRGVVLRTAQEAELPMAAAAPQLVERALTRLIATIVSVAGPGEMLTLATASRGGGLQTTIERPAALRGQSDAALLDPDIGPDGELPDAPLLGLGFTLRLVANLAREAGGRLVIHPDRFELFIPTIGEMASGSHG